MVSDGFTPREVGIAELSMQKRPSLSNASQPSSTTPRSLESANSAAAERVGAVSAARPTIDFIAALAASRTCCDWLESAYLNSPTVTGPALGRTLSPCGGGTTN